MTRFFFSFKLT